MGYNSKKIYGTEQLKNVNEYEYWKEKLLPVKLPQFYKEVIFSWHSCGGGLKAPQSEAEIRKQLIWGNKYIQTKGKTIFYENWHKSNINFIDDLLDETGNLKSGTEIFQQLQGYSRVNWLIEYNTILKSIPETWKNMLKDINMGIKVKKDLKLFIYTGNKYIFELPSKAKDYYTILIGKLKEKSYIEKYWDNVLPNKTTWHENWKTQTDKKLAEFHYKLIHRILPCQENLYKWKLSNSNACRFGCPTVETYNHMFLTCPRLKLLYIKLEKIFQNIGFTMKLTYRTLLFGHKATYTAYQPVNNLLSYIFYAIYKHWLHNNVQTDIATWLHSHLIFRKKIHLELNDQTSHKLLDNVLKEW